MVIGNLGTDHREQGGETMTALSLTPCAHPWQRMRFMADQTIAVCLACGKVFDGDERFALLWEKVNERLDELFEAIMSGEAGAIRDIVKGTKDEIHRDDGSDGSRDHHRDPGPSDPESV